MRALKTEKKARWMPKRSLYTCMTTCMNHEATAWLYIYDPWKQRGHFDGLPGLPLTQFRVVFDVSVENFWNKRNVWKGIRLFSLLENSRRKFGFHVFKPFLNISFRLSQPFFLKRNWLRQMVNAITERNQNSAVLNSVHHLPAQTVKRPVYPCKK